MEEKRREAEEGPEAAAVLAQAVLEERCTWPGWSPEADALLERLETVRGWGESGWPFWDEEAKRMVLQRQCEGCLTWRQANEVSALGAIREWLGKERVAQLEILAPERIQLPGGKSAKVRYGKGREAVLAQAVLEERCAWPGWSPEADALLERLETVRAGIATTNSNQPECATAEPTC